jgi:hypothetical protein
MPPKKRKRVSSSDDTKTARLSSDETKTASSELSRLLEIARTRHPICGYPDSPAQYFHQRRKEAAESEQGTLRLVAIFAPEPYGGLFYLPKTLIDLCAAYYKEEINVVIERLISDLDELNNAGGFLTGDVIPPMPEADLRFLNAFEMTVEYRVVKYLRWFRLRNLIPQFVNIDDIEYEVRDSATPSKYIRVLAGDQPIVELHIDPYMPSFRCFCGNVKSVLNHFEQAMNRSTDLCGHMLPTKTTFRRIQKCESLPSTSKIQVEAAKFFVWFAATQIWVSDKSNFSHLPQPDESQRASKEEWNRWHRYFRLGPPFSLL